MAVSAEPALLTFLIADVRGYTRFTVEHGDEAAARLATTFAAIASETIEPAGGRVIELRGDEVLAVFPSARQALRAAIDLQTRLGEAATDGLPLRAGIGIDAGEAIPVDGGYRGAALNLAARLCSLAGPGEVLASDTVTNLARKLEGLSYLERGATEMKGFASRVMVMQVLREVAPTQAVPEQLVAEEQRLPIGGFLGALPANPLVARDRELARIRDEAEVVRRGQGRLVLLTGEPGVGKTRLAQEITLHVRNLGFLVASGRCYEPEENVPYYPYREALGMLYDAAPAGIRADLPRLWPHVMQLLPREIGQSSVPSSEGGSQEEQQRLFYAVTGFVQAVAETQPVALLLDDLHWADGSSLKLLQYMARHTRTNPILLLGTYRDVEVGRQHPLERALRDLNREGLVEEIAVRRLDRDGTAALTATTFGESEISPEFADLLYRHTEGNAFFTHEVLRALVERGDLYEANGRWERRDVEEIEVPKSVRSTVGERVSRLEEEAQEVLAEASVLGQTFAFDELQALGERSERRVEAALEAAEAAGLVRSQGRDEYAFNHALTQQVLYDELSPRRRRRLHLAAATALEEGPHPERRAAELAWHFLQGDDPEKALPYALQAGDQAEAAFAHSEAEHHYRVAVGLAKELENREARAEGLAKLGHVLGHGTDLDEAVRILKEADRLFQELDDIEGQRRVIARAGGLVGVRHIVDTEIQQRFAELLAGSEPSEGLARLYIFASSLAFTRGRYQENYEMAVRAGEIARAIGSDYLLADAEMRRGTAIRHIEVGPEGVEAAAELLERAVELAEKSGNESALVIALNNLAFMYQLRGDFAKNLVYRRRSLEQQQRMSEAIGQIFANAMVAQGLHYLGRIEEARPYAEEAVRRVRTMEPLWHSAYALSELGVARMLEGRWEEAEALVREGIGISASHHDPQARGLQLLILAQLYLLQDDPDRAFALYESDDDIELEEWALSPLADACIGVGDEDRAVPIIDRLTEPGWFFTSEGLRLHGLMAARRGDPQQAKKDFEDALALAREHGYALEEGRILHEQALLLAATGDRDRALQQMGSVVRFFREMGAHAYADRAEKALNQMRTT